MKIVHLITGLNIGGAEMMLYKLVREMSSTRFSNRVVSLTSEGSMAQRIEAVGVPVTFVGMKADRFGARDLVKVWSAMKVSEPDIIQTWMYHADLIGGLTNLFSKRPLIWNIRASGLAVKGIKKRTRAVIHACAFVSTRIPTRIVCCSEAARDVHAELGYDVTRMTVIPNGFDLSEFQQSDQARREVREELKVSPNTILIGLVGRFYPLKDHETFFHAASLIARRFPDVHFVLCGQGMSWENASVAALIDPSIRDRVHLLGKRIDIPRITASFDIACLSSYSEGFPNVVGEAMASGIPCVVTDVGDAAAMVGDTGIVVPPRAADEFAEACCRLLDLPQAERERLGTAARRRIQERFSLAEVVRRYEALYEEVGQAAGARRRSKETGLSPSVAKDQDSSGTQS